MPNIDDLYQSDSKWLTAADLQGKEIKLVISDGKKEDVGDKAKWVVYFAGKEKGLVLNVTNARMIGDSYGKETDGWPNKEVVLYPTKTDYQGKLVDCIRVRIPTSEALDDEIPF